jgi:Zn-dependent M28 family amino/carboxypeptidase
VTFEGPRSLAAEVVLAKVAGRDPSENLVVSAPSDAYFIGANDNASGVAALIALARHYAKGPKPQHDIYFFLSPGHHDPTAGTKALSDHRPALAKQNIVLLNLEHIGQAGVYRSYMRTRPNRYGEPVAAYVPTNWDSQGREVTLAPDSPAIRAAWGRSAVRYGYTGPGVISQPAIADPAGWVAAGGAAVQDVETSPWFHTTGDTPETLSPEAMQRVTLFYRGFLDDMDRSSRAKVWSGAKPLAPAPFGG